MFSRTAPSPRPKTEAERPFWISYADLMTAMMVLCLATMAITIVAVSKKLTGDANRMEENRKICDDIKQRVKGTTLIAVDCKNFKINFGTAGEFGKSEYKLPIEANQALAELVPVILQKANTATGRKYLKQVVVEGFASATGDYLLNLDLSIKRSHWVMCLLTDPNKNNFLTDRVSPAQLQDVQRLFSAGGVSFNQAKATPEASQRVELRLEFFREDDLERARGDALAPLPVGECKLQ